MKGRGAGSQFMEDNAHPEQVKADDDMLNNMTHQKWIRWKDLKQETK
jgi:hypothetical protein